MCWPTASPPTWANWRWYATSWSRSCRVTATTSRTRFSFPSAWWRKTVSPPSISRNCRRWRATPSSDVKDPSLRVPSGISGTVIDVQVFTREGVEKDARAKSIEESGLASIRKDLDDQYRILENDAFARLERQLIGKVADGGPAGLENGDKITKGYLEELPRTKRFDIRLKNEEASQALEQIRGYLAKQKDLFDQKFTEKKVKLTSGDDLAPGVLKMVKVYVAVKRRLQPGDKMAGRHGNKGVISRIVAVEDMPYVADGTPADIVLNPLGVPSRMNVGQVL